MSEAISAMKEPPLTEDQALSYWTIMQRYGYAKQFRHAIIEECARRIEDYDGVYSLHSCKPVFAAAIRALKS